MKKIKNTNTNKTAVKVGAGLAAATVAAVAGFYFYGSKNAKNHRKIAAKWATDMKREVIKEAKQLKNAGPKEFSKIVDRVAKTYRIARSVDSNDLKRAAKELKANWDMVKRETKKTVRKSVSRASATAKRVK